MKKNKSDYKIGRIFFILIMLSLFSSIVFAIPNSLTLQGKLTNLAGASQAGAFNFSFKIYSC